MRSIKLSVLSSASLAAAANTNKPLVPWAFDPLPLGAVKPAGWLLDQLQLEGDGLAGHLYEFYDYVAHEVWLGGEMAYSDLHEGFPYWYNGLVPLAYHLDDGRLKEQVHNSTQYILDNQQKDGWIGPEQGTARNFWARHMVFLGLIQLADANKTWEGPILDAFGKFMPLMHSMLSENYTGYLHHDGDVLQEADADWGRVRSQDLIISLQWLYEKHPGNLSDMIFENMQYLHNAGINWEDFYNNAAYIGQGYQNALGTLPDDVTSANYPYEHGVNVGQGLKAAAVIRRFTHNDSLIQTAYDGVNWTMSFHGAASGTILGDERLQGLMPYSGSELCTTVETMYSLAYLYQALGDKFYAERAEIAAYNALPGTLTPDWWARQYVTQPNQPYAVELRNKSVFYNVDSVGQTFGLEPDYPCCTVNHGQGYPKFASNLYARVGSNGLAHVLLAPGSVTSKLRSGEVQVDVSSGYPFLDTIFYSITSHGPFDFYVRVPSFSASKSSISVNGANTSPLSPDETSGLHKVSLAKGINNITYTIVSDINPVPRANDTVAVYKGSLLFTIEIGVTNTSTLPKMYSDSNVYYPSSYAPAQSRDWEYHNTTAWNIAIDPSTLNYHAPNASSPAEVPSPIFAPGADTGFMTAQGCDIDWPLYLDTTPGYAPPDGARKCLGDAREVRLAPYGAAKLHMAEIPTVSLDTPD